MSTLLSIKFSYWHLGGWRSVMAICREDEGGSTGQGDYGSEFIVFSTD